MTTAVRLTLSASSLIGNDVRNRAGEDLGSIKELMLDVSTGHVAYAVLSFGGFLGLGDKLFAVPWNALELDTANHAFVFDVDKEVLKHAEGFDKEHWPDMADRSWGTRIHDFYGTRPYWD